jgi:2-polyprenyl-3-methyl-5-hydroxy-6-metoxy-1,4-benzoquinol methylase
MSQVDGQVASEARQGGHLERFDPVEQGGKLIDAEHRGRYWWVAQIVDGKDVLDAGCGTGYGARILAAAGAASVTGVDVSAEAVEATKETPGLDAVVQADLRDLPFDDDSFDLVVCWEVIEHIEEGARAIAEFRRVLRPDGILLVSSPNPDVYPSGNEHHVHEYRPRELAAMLAERFANLASYRQHAWLASVIESTESRRSGELEEPATLRTENLEAGGETYGLVAASDGPLPELRDLVALGSAFEVAWWQDQLSGTKKLLAEAEAREATAVSHYHDASRALLEANQALAQIPVLSHQAEEMHAAINGIESSISWRLTAPLRRLRRLGRR